MCEWVTLQSFQYPDYIELSGRLTEEMKKNCKEPVIVQLRYYIGNCLEKPKKILSGLLVSWMRFDLSTS
jgi:hypothetical protein